MGRTFKDQHKYDKKNKQKDDDNFKAGKKPAKQKKYYEETIAPEDELDTYEQYEYEYDDTDYYPRR
jgi:hypothetical protein